MKRAVHIILTVTIIIFALGCIYVSFVLMATSGFIFFGDLDLNETQRQAAEKRRTVFSIVCMLVFLLSGGLLFLSSSISRFILCKLGFNLQTSEDS